MEKTNKYKDKYLIYARKSTDDSDNQKNSVDYQIGSCLKYSHSKNITVAKLNIDGFCQDGIIKEKHSAYKTSSINFTSTGSINYKIERPKFQQLVSLLLSRQFAGIICLCWDRISRNDQDAMVIKDLINRGVDIQFVQTQYDKNSSGALHMDIDSMFSAHYSRVISEKVKMAHEKLRAEGKCVYITPLGYLDKGSDNKPLDPERAPIVKQIFERYATGTWSMSQLAKWAAQQGLTSKPSRITRTRKEILSGEDNNKEKICRPVNDRSIENILKNPFYIGKILAGNDYLDGIHQPLIDRSLYNRVQEALKGRCVSVHYVDKSFFTYRGLVNCPCSRVYTPYVKKGFTYYRSRCRANCDNTNRNLREDEITAQIEPVLNRIHFTPEELSDIAQRSKFELKRISEKQTESVGSVKKQKQRLAEDLRYLEDNKISLLRQNILDIKQYNQDKNTIEAKIEELDEEILKSKTDPEEMLSSVLNFSELMKNASLYYKNSLDSEKRELTVNVFSELIMTGRILANYKAKEGFDALLKRHDANGGSGTRIRTWEIHVNSVALYRSTIPEW